MKKEKFSEIADPDAWIQTFLGKKFYPLLPDPAEIHITDIAHMLSNQCRFAGATREFYSVAQHSVLVSLYCRSENALWGLLHDASEAYLIDLPRPLKRHPLFQAYRDAEKHLQSVIYGWFGLMGRQPADVHKADLAVWAAESRDLMSPLHPDYVINVQPIRDTIQPVGPIEAKKMFLERFADLSGAPAAEEGARR